MLICTKGVWGRGNAQTWSNLAVLRGPHAAGLENWHDDWCVVMRFRGAVAGAVDAVWDARRQLLARWEPFVGTQRPFALHRDEKMHAPVCTLLQSFRPTPPGASSRMYFSQASRSIVSIVHGSVAPCGPQQRPGYSSGFTIEARDLCIGWLDI